MSARASLGLVLVVTAAITVVSAAQVEQHRIPARHQPTCSALEHPQPHAPQFVEFSINCQSYDDNQPFPSALDIGKIPTRGEAPAIACAKGDRACNSVPSLRTNVCGTVGSCWRRWSGPRSPQFTE